MPLQKLIFKPGVNREGTTLTNEGSWFETDKVRFRSGFPEKIGGWTAISTNKFLGVCRSLWNWITLKNFNLLGVGTNQKFYIENGGNYYDITPLSGVPADVTDIEVNNGSYRALVTVTGAGSFQTGDIVELIGVTNTPTDEIGGVPVAVFNQQYFVNYVSGTQFEILLREISPLEAPGAYYPATSDATVSFFAPLPTAEFLLSSGLPIYTIGTGWGVGPWAPHFVATLTDPFTTYTSVGDESKLRIDFGGAHGLSPGDYITIQSIADDFGGLQLSPSGIPLTSAVLQRTFEIVSVISANVVEVSMSSGTGAGAVDIVATVADVGVGGAVVIDYPDTALIPYGWGDGYTATSAAGLQLRLWSQSNFGEELLINPRGGSIYVWQPGSNPTPDFASRAFLLTGTNIPEQVNEVLVSDATRITIAFGCNDYDPPLSPTGAFDPMLIRWSTNEDYEAWTPSATNQAGSYRLSHGSEIISALQTRQEILVWTDSALYSMQYLGPPYVWGFNILADNISLMSPNAMATANGVVYWMGTDKFYAYSGRVETLPSALRQFVFQDINKDQSFQVFASTNEGYSEVWWFYCSTNSSMINRYVVYNYLENVWYYGEMQRTAWLDSATRQYPQAANGVQNTTLAQPISSATATEISVLNASSFPNSGYVQINDEVIYYAENNITTLNGCIRGQIGSTATTHAIDTVVYEYGGNVVLFHEFGNDDASDPERPRAIESFIQSSDIDLDDGDHYMFVWQMVPDFSFDGSTTADPNKPEVLLQLRPRQNPGSPYGYGPAPTVASTQSYNNTPTYTVQEFTELVNTRVRGRQMALRITSDTLGTKWQLGAIRVNMRPDGRR